MKYLLIILALLLPASAMADVGITLGWNANSEDDLAGYKLYWGKQSRKYNRTVDVGDVTEFTLAPFEHETTYYFAVTAYDLDGNESDYSKELAHTTKSAGVKDTTPPSKPGSFKIKATIVWEVKQ